MSFEVIKPGFLALIQDLGRFGFQHMGVTTGGPMDEHAFCWANRLLGNKLNAPQLEITFGQLTLKAHENTCIALTGADLNARLNDKKVHPWRTYRVRKGDTVTFESPICGLRSYLAVIGGFEIDPKLGSVASVTREQIGGLRNGESLKVGDRLYFRSSIKQPHGVTPTWAIPDYQAPLELGVMLGYQDKEFPNTELMTLLSCEYEVSQNIDRMGYRLTGAPIRCNRDGIVSEGIAYGAIQIPQDGQPIVLMKDRQTIGGYPKVGSLSALDAGQLAQRAPGSLVRFCLSDIAEAEAKRMVFNRIMIQS